MAGKIYITEKHAHTALKKARHPSLSSNWVRSLLWLEKNTARPQRQTCFSQTRSYSRGKKNPTNTRVNAQHRAHEHQKYICHKHAISAYVDYETCFDDTTNNACRKCRKCLGRNLCCGKYPMSLICPILPGIKVNEI